ncbi:MAG: 4-hydroxybenzoate polyprenyltransferase [Actinophytocola sp.]|nr:4-hydroxybenzoate polyprenyltransferase [Actinophytocola sp.]
MAAFAELVRAPAALTVIGDTAVGAAASGPLLHRSRLLFPLASVALYWAGMALNDWADRELDATERPERPIPSGRVSDRDALAIAAGLTSAGLALSAAAGGHRGLRSAVLLTGAICAYDTRLKGTVAGPAGMAMCRMLDVLLGAWPGNLRAAAPAAAALGVHTLGVTALAAGEVHGGSRAGASGALAGTALSALLGALGPTQAPRHRMTALACAFWYAATVGRTQFRAALQPSAARVRAATVGGIHGMVPLQAGLLARHGALRTATVLAAALPLAQRFARRVSPT